MFHDSLEKNKLREWVKRSSCRESRLENCLTGKMCFAGHKFGLYYKGAKKATSPVSSLPQHKDRTEEACGRRCSC